MELLEKYDVKLNDAILADPGGKHMPLYDELVADYKVQYIAGGAGQNSMRVAQWMLGVPNTTAYFGCVGDDAYGEQLATCSRDDGVNVCYMVTDKEKTGTCAVLINEGERSLVANLGAANSFNVSHLESESAKNVMANASIYYVTGFFLTVSVDSILKLAKDASADEKKVFCMNLSAPFLIQFFGEQMATCMPYTDFVFGNESEAAEYGKAKGYGEDLKEIALKLSAEPKADGARPRVVVFTQGSECTIVACNGEATVYDVDALPKDLLVDTNGAGDAFVGGFLAMLWLKKPIAECVRAGHWAARTIIQRSGCSFPKECTYV